jgi:hypothetical protein
MQAKPDPMIERFNTKALQQGTRIAGSIIVRVNYARSRREVSLVIVSDRKGKKAPIRHI